MGWRHTKIIAQCLAMSDSNYNKDILECLLIFSINSEASILPEYNIIIFMFLLLSDNCDLLVIHSIKYHPGDKSYQFYTDA